MINSDCFGFSPFSYILSLSPILLLVLSTSSAVPLYSLKGHIKNRKILLLLFTQTMFSAIPPPLSLSVCRPPPPFSFATTTKQGDSICAAFFYVSFWPNSNNQSINHKVLLFRFDLNKTLGFINYDHHLPKQ